MLLLPLPDLLRPRSFSFTRRLRLREGTDEDEELSSEVLDNDEDVEERPVRETDGSVNEMSGAGREDVWKWRISSAVPWPEYSPYWES